MKKNEFTHLFFFSFTCVTCKILPTRLASSGTSSCSITCPRINTIAYFTFHIAVVSIPSRWTCITAPRFFVTWFRFSTTRWTFLWTVGAIRTDWTFNAVSCYLITYSWNKTKNSTHMFTIFAMPPNLTFFKRKKREKKIYNNKIMKPTFVLERMVRNKNNKKWQFDLISFLFELNKKLLFTVIRTTCNYKVKINVTICRIHITNSKWFQCLNQQAFCRWKICSAVESLYLFSSFIICDFKCNNLN